MGFVFKPQISMITAAIGIVGTILTQLATQNPEYSMLFLSAAYGLTQGVSYYEQQVQPALAVPVKTSNTTATISIAPSQSAASTPPATLVTLADGSKAVVPLSAIQKVQG